MDALVVIPVCVTVVAALYLVTRTLGKYFEAQIAVKKQMSAVRAARTAKQRGGPTREEVADWVKELLEQFGHSADELYEEEPPEDLEKLLSSPMVKSFIQGLNKGSGDQQQQLSTEAWL